jgi:hypothetical protein
MEYEKGTGLSEDCSPHGRNSTPNLQIAGFCKSPDFANRPTLKEIGNPITTMCTSNPKIKSWSS